MIEPYNSGQDYISDAAELAYAQEHNLQDTQDSAMQEVGGEGDPHGESIQETPKILNGKQLSENAGYIIDALAPTSLDGKIVKFDWHNIEQLLASDSKSMNPDKYDALNYVFGQMHTIDDLQKFINLCYTVPIAPDSGDSQQDDNVYAVPNEILTNMMDYYACESEKGTLDQVLDARQKFWVQLLSAAREYISLVKAVNHPFCWNEMALITLLLFQRRNLVNLQL